MRFGIGQIIYLEDRKVYIANRLGVDENKPEEDWDTDLDAADRRLRDELTDPTSPLASELVYNFSRTMSLRQDFVWNGNENRVDNYGITYRYQRDHRSTLNLGFRFRDEVDRYMKDSDDQLIPDAGSPTELQNGQERPQADRPVLCLAHPLHQQLDGPGPLAIRFDQQAEP